MRRMVCMTVMTLCVWAATMAQTPLKRVYNESIDPIAQIDSAVAVAKAEGKFVMCQVGGNWCPWCLRFADFITADTAIARVVATNYEYIHVNYNPRRDPSPVLMKRLANCGRFGFPVLVVLDADGKVMHIQDSSFLEEGQGYDKEKVMRFFTAWTPLAVSGAPQQ